MSYIEGQPRRQKILFPDVIDDYIRDDNPVRFIDVFVDSLDFKELGFKYSDTKETGRPPYNPADMLKLYLYGYLNRIRSSRRLEKETHRNVELMWLLKKLAPDFKTIADFRKDNKRAIRGVCKQFILFCKGLDLFGCELIAIDGSKFKASNSKKRNFNERKLKRKLMEIEDKVEEYLIELDENDRVERDVPYPDKEELEKKIDELKERKDEYNKLLKDIKESGDTQISLTDPDARNMPNNQRTEVSYNVQFTVDNKHKLIIDYDITNEVNDQHQLSKMAKRAKEILGVEEIEALADKGYYNGEEIKECIDNGIKPYVPELKHAVSKKIDKPRPEFYKDKFRYNKEKDVYICPEGRELRYSGKGRHNGKNGRLYNSKECGCCEKQSLCTKNKNGRIIYRWEHEGILDNMIDRIKKDKEKVKLRNSLIEHIFGTIKRNFNQGYLLLRGKEKVSAEIGLTVLAYNITRVINIVGLEKLIKASKLKNFLFNEMIIAIKMFFHHYLNFYSKNIRKILSIWNLKGFIPSFHTV